MNITDFFNNFSSDTVAGSGNQLLITFSEKQTSTGRVAYKLADGGKNYSLLFSNIIDSTYHNGQYSKCNDIGEPWQIHQLKVGISDNYNDYPENMTVATFNGSSEKSVSGRDIFCTDPILLNAEKGQYLHLEMTFTGISFPRHCEINLNIEKKDENGNFVFNSDMPVPLMIGSDRKVKKRIGFIGDSITQGLGTPKESYKHWVALIKDNLESDISVWDLGIGFAKAYDASSNGFWLERAKKCDVVNICFGVNDILINRTFEEIISDLETINSLLKEAGCKTVISTIPPFDFVGKDCEKWMQANDYIRNVLSQKTDGFFDFAKYTSKDAPENNIAKYGGHPDIEGCSVIAKAYLKDVVL